MKHSNTYSWSKLPNFFTVEYFLCLLLLLVGISGLHCMLQDPPHWEPSVYNQPKPKHFQTNKKVLTSALEKKSQKVSLHPPQEIQIFGVAEAREKLVFQMPPLHTKLEYRLDFGNGKVIDVKKERLHYAYPKAGRYEITLQGTYQNKTKTIARKTIVIEKAIEVANTAFLEIED